MKILIADDEELTRTGVIASVNWDALGIDTILQADDGLHGLETALLERPDLILCDVRMPRMDGIAMLEQISKHLPETTVIFMSGYSDKEYLKAAIKLKAVNYIEKPINKAEIEATLQDAVKLHAQKLRSQRVEALHSMETSSRLAHLLTEPGTTHADEISNLMEELALPSGPASSFLTLIVQLEQSAEPGSAFIEQTNAALRASLADAPIHLLFERRRQQYLVYTFVSATALTEHTQQTLLQILKQQLASFPRHYITLGDSHQSCTEAHRSYEEAVILLQYCYFFPAGTVLSSSRLAEQAVTSPVEQIPTDAEFVEALNSGIPEKAEAVLDTLYRCFHQNYRLLPNQAKDLYFKLFYALEDVRIQHQLLADHTEDNAVSIMEQCFSFEELHRELAARTARYYSDLGEHAQENSTILMIKDYISQNYSKETLSVKEISSYVFLSTSYVCTFFKSETGKTLNQFLTEYRMEKAKQLLDDPRYKISEISSQVGYSDGNYFGKSFKKYTGISPSEYRERKNLS